jgi:hypothetical protein
MNSVLLMAVHSGYKKSLTVLVRDLRESTLIVQIYIIIVAKAVYISEA